MKLIDWNILLSYISDFSDWLPLAIYFSLSEEKKRPFQFLGAYLFINSLLKTSTFIILSFGKANTLPFYHALSIVELSFLFLFYSEILFYSRWKWIVLICILILNVSNTAFYQPLEQFNSYAWSINSIILMCMGLYSFYKLYLNIEDIRLNKYPHFIINSGLLIYLSGSLFTYILGSDILSREAKDFFHNAWIIKSFSDIVKSVLLTYGLWVARQN